MQFSAEVLDKLADAMSNAGYLISPRDFHDLVKKVEGQVGAKGRGSNFGENAFSITRFIRGLTAMGGNVINAASRENDLQYAQKTLLTGTTPGSYLVPTIQADAIIGLLTSAHVIRAAGCRV